MSYTKQPMFYVRDYRELGYAHREVVADHAARIEPIADSIIDACRDENYGSPEAAAKDRARLIDYRDRGATHTVEMWSSQSVRLDYCRYNDSPTARWSSPGLHLPTDMTYVDPAFEAFKRLRTRMYKLNQDWRDIDQLCATLERMGYKRCYLAPYGAHGGTAPVMLRKGLTDLEPARALQAEPHHVGT